MTSFSKFVMILCFDYVYKFLTRSKNKSIKGVIERINNFISFLNSSNECIEIKLKFLLNKFQADPFYKRYKVKVFLTIYHVSCMDRPNFKEEEKHLISLSFVRAPGRSV